MTAILTCPKCTRTNPPEAVYCFFDGFVLGGGTGGPLAINSQRFPGPFVFPNGRTCLNFDDLVIACHEENKAAADLLKQGFLESFLGSIGRMDLAMAARESAKFPDPARGLDELLGKMPSSVLSDAKLNVSTNEVNLGKIDRNPKNPIRITIENGGMRLLYGAIQSDSLWVAIGDSGNASVKNFQTKGELTVPIRIVPEQLRASDKPLVAKVKISSSGGKSEILIKAELPVVPFPDGVLAGSLTPRQIAEKAKLKPKEAAIQFENGQVAAWYQTNGWSFPVQGPVARGMGAIQQYFEALGLTSAPKCKADNLNFDFTADPGQSLAFEIQISTDDKKLVFAHGSAEQSWIKALDPVSDGKTVALKFEIPEVPESPGETLESKIHIVANGGQKFLANVHLLVSGRAKAKRSDPSPELVFSAPVQQAPPGLKATDIPEPEDEIKVEKLRQKTKSVAAPIPWVHALPAVFLLVILLGFTIFDAFTGSKAKVAEVATKSSIGYQFQSSKKLEQQIDFNHLKSTKNFRFGIVLPGKKDPKGGGGMLRLTFDEAGASNNTRIKIDNADYLYVQKGVSRVVEDKEPNTGRVWRTACDYTLANAKGGKAAELIRVSQLVQVVPGNEGTALDTVLVKYSVENRGKEKHKIGLRVMLDTFIGGEDGVPFVIPGAPGFVTSQLELPQKEIPDYIQAMEHQDLEKPGIVALLGLKGFQLPDCEPEPLYKLMLGENPNNSEAGYDIDIGDLAPKGKKAGDGFKDSVVFLYWNERDTNPGETRNFVFSYGLSEISKPTGSSGGNLSISHGSNIFAKKSFALTALVRNAVKGQEVSLELPPGVSLASGENLNRKVEEVDKATTMSQVSWKITVDKPGDYTFKVSTDKNASQAKIKVKDPSSSLFR